MLYGLKIIKLKNEVTCILKSPTEKQLERYFDYHKQVAEETDFLIRTKDDFTDTVINAELNNIGYILGSPNDLVITAWISGEMAAEIILYQVSSYQKQHHRAYLSISVKKIYWSLGLGSIMMSEIINAANEMGFEQIELDVIADNVRAIQLYKKFGFQIFGTNERAVKQTAGTYRAAHSMVLYLL